VRLRQLDVLRGIAVMLVLFRHHPGPAVVVGVIMARLVERPALALRDRLVPSRTGRLVVATPDVPTVADVAVAGAGS
jgi:peptidoglycan/LPS O-acetylase OafA/YrhL